MSETATTTPVAPAPGSDQGTPAATATTVPEGYVPAAEVESAREEARRRYQGEKDRLEAEVARLKAGSTPAPAATTPPAEGSGSDLDAFRRQLLTDVYGAAALSTASEKIRAEFPHADPGLFTPEKLSEFSSPDALRFAAEDSHKRVAAIFADRDAAVRKTVLEELAAAGVQLPAATGDGVTPAGIVPAGGGDPSPAEMAAMSVDQLNALEKERPGVTDRVLAKAGGA